MAMRRKSPDPFEGPVGGGLPALTDALLPDEKYREIFRQFSNVESSILEELDRLGFPVLSELEEAKAPGAFPKTDMEKLASSGPAGYERAYNELLLWQGFLCTLLARAENNVLSSKNGLNAVRSSIQKEMAKGLRAGVYRNLEEMNAHLDSHPVVLEATINHQKAVEIRSFLQAYEKRVDQQIKAVSRHVTIREQEAFHSPDRIQKMPAPGSLPGGRYMPR